MTDRYHALTVVLEQNIREDDAEGLINAIRHIKGVSGVTPHVADINTHSAETRARLRLREQIGKILWPDE